MSRFIFAILYKNATRRDLFYFDDVAAEGVPEVGADIGGAGKAQDARVVAHLAHLAGTDAAGELVVYYSGDAVALDKAERLILKREKVI